MVIRFYILLAMIFFSGFIQGQNEQKYYIGFAEAAMADGDYFGASRYYRKALSYDASDIKLQYSYAQSLRLSSNYVDAEDWYIRVYRKERGQFFPNGPYWIAQVMEANGNYEDAIRYWDKVMHNEPESSSKYAWAKQRMTSCHWAMNAMKNDSLVNIVVENMGEQINSPESEFGVHLMKDSSLVFASLRGEYNKEQELKDTIYYTIDLYRARLNEDALVMKLDSALGGPNRRVANATFDKAEENMYFSMCEIDGPCSIYHCSISKDGFSNPVKLDAKINAPASSSTMPHLAEKENETLLLFCSDRPTGMGGMDIYFSEWENNGWSTPEPIDEINSPGNEISPYTAEHSDLLYFSSDWHSGFGLMDIFSWTKGGQPVNLGRPFNSSLNDMYFQMSEDSTGFLTSNRPGSYSLKGETCCNDIWEFRQPKAELDYMTEEDVALQLDTIDTSTPLPTEVESIDELADYLPITLYFHNDRPDPKTVKATTKQSYGDTYREYDELQYRYEAEVSAGLSMPQASGALNGIRTFFKEIEREYERLDEVCRLLHQELEKGRTIELVIKGYASPLAQSEYNEFLTMRRIQSLVNQLQRWNDGALAGYMEEGVRLERGLIIERIPFGESQSDSAVSDQQADQKQSIYSVAAAKERRIEILRISEK